MSHEIGAHKLQTFERLSPYAKSLWIISICAVLGILSGFAVYLTFAKLMIEANAQARLLALLIGLVVAIAVSYVVDWLREAIASGRTEVPWPTWRALLPVVVVLAVFELAITIVNDTAKDIIVEYNTIKSIAARIAGQDVATLGPDQDMAALDARLSSHVAQHGLPAPAAAPAASVDGRILQLMQPRQRLLLFAGLEGGRGIVGRRISEELLVGLHRDLARDPGLRDAQRSEEAAGRSIFELALGRLPRWIVRCRADGIGRGETAALAACRAAVEELSAGDRHVELWGAMARIFQRHDLYHPSSFAGARLDAHLVQTVEGKLCAFGGAARPSWCTKAAGGDRKGGGGQVPPGPLEIAQLNHELLVAAEMPGFKPLRSFWLAFWQLLAIWCVAAVALGGILVTAIFLSDRFVDGPEATSDRFFLGVIAVVATGVVAAVLVATVQSVPFAWQLLFAPCSIDDRSLLRRDLRAVLDLLPALVRGLASCSAPGTWLYIPGWISTAGLVAGLSVLRGRLSRRIPERHKWWAVPLSWLLIPLAFAGPLISDPLLELAQVVGFTWLIPAMGFALLLPYLKPASRMPKLWAAAAFLVAVILLGWTWLRLAELDTIELTFLVVATAFALAIGAMILSEATMGELWPVLAMTMALAAVGLSEPLQSTTFSSVLNSLTVVSDGAARRLPMHLQHLHPDWAQQLLPTTSASEAAPPADATASKADGGPDLAEPPPPGGGFTWPYVPSPVTATTDRRQAVRLELSLVGALSFWLTLGLLACWRLRETTNEAPAEVQAGG